MRHAVRVVLGILLGAQISQAEPRTFTNIEGRTVKADLVALEDKTVVMKLTNRKIAKVALSSLTDQDQAFIKAWWVKNKNKLNSMDVRLTLDKNTKQIDRQSSRSGGNTGGNNRQTAVQVKKSSKHEISFAGELKSFARKQVEDITIEYTIYKRISTRTADGSDTTTEEIDGETTIRHLEAFGTTTFETEVVTCDDSSESGGNKSRTSNRETIVGFVVTLSAGGEEFLKQSHPENFLDKLEEEEKREEERSERE